MNILRRATVPRAGNIGDATMKSPKTVGLGVTVSLVAVTAAALA
ncbi:hypothetical protein [Mesorhizobium hawassense]|nr:hypothetical protein [Mesorhizobium hawassense]